MKSVSNCTMCGLLTTHIQADRCGLCYSTTGLVGTLVPAGILLDPLDVAAVVADEGDKILAECARALDSLEAG